VFRSLQGDGMDDDVRSSIEHMLTDATEEKG
jgi:hypothetical protein